MQILICYASSEGQTRKIALRAAEMVMQLGHKSNVKNVRNIDDRDIQECDAVILAGSLHIGRYQSELVDCISTRLRLLQDRPAGFISVSLSAAGDENDLQGARRCMQKLTDETGWTPDMVHHAAGAFTFTEYGFFKRLVMRYIAGTRHQEVKAGQDLELTDWTALECFVAEFAEYATGRKAA